MAAAVVCKPACTEGIGATYPLEGGENQSLEWVNKFWRPGSGFGAPRGERDLFTTRPERGMAISRGCAGDDDNAASMSRRAPLLVVLALALAISQGVAAGARDITTLEKRVDAVEARAAELDAAAGAAASRHNAAMDRFAAARAGAATARREFVRTQGQLVVARETLSARLVALYRRPDPDLLALLASSESLSDLMGRATALQGAAGEDAGLVRAVRSRRVALRATQQRLSREMSTARRQAAVARRERARIGALMAEQSRVVESARGELKAALAARVQSRVRAARAKGSTVIPVAPNGTEPVFPIAAPSTFSDDWMAPRGGRFHEGIDIMAERGTPIVAVVSGTVIRIGTTPVSGNRFWLRAPNGDEYFYCHLDGFAPAAQEGASVAVGTVLGYTGDTGDAKGTTPHLHFEIHPGGGGPIRPYPLVSSWPRVG